MTYARAALCGLSLLALGACESLAPLAPAAAELAVRAMLCAASDEPRACR